MIKMKCHSSTVLLLIILSVATVLRLYQIDQPFVSATSWRESDNATIADNYYRGNWNIFLPQISWNGPDPNFVGYEFQTVTYLAALLYRLFGQHNWVARGVVVTFGVWGVFALYQLVRRVWGERYALVSAAIIAILPGSIFVSRSFISGPLMVSLMTTSLWLIVAYVQTDRLRYLLLGSLICTWGLLTKISGIFIGIPMLYAIIAVLHQRQKLQFKRIIVIGVAAICTLVPVIAYYLWAHYVASHYPPYHIAGSGNWLWNHGLAKWLREFYYLPQMSYVFNLWFWTKPVIALVLIGVCLRPPQLGQSSGHLTEPTRLPWLFHWWLAACILFYLIGAKELVDNPHNFEIVNPAAAALAAHSVLTIGDAAKQWIHPLGGLATVAAVLTVISGFGFKNLPFVYSPYAQSGYQLGLGLRQVSQPGDLVVTIAPEIGNPVAIYYSQRKGWTFPPAWRDIVWWDTITDDRQASQLLDELRQQGADWLGIVNEQWIKLQQNNANFVQHIQQTCELQQENADWIIYRILPKPNS